MTVMPRLPSWVWIGGALLLVLLADWLDHQRPFPPVWRNTQTARRA